PDAVLSRFLKTGGIPDAPIFAALASKNRAIAEELEKHPNSFERRALRTNIYLGNAVLPKLGYSLAPDESVLLTQYQVGLGGLFNFSPVWVKALVAFTLGLGTMIGWKRIVVTVGEKIGKEHLSYAQGGSAELVAFGTIIAADRFGVPVSTTHVLSSGIAG